MGSGAAAWYHVVMVKEGQPATPSIPLHKEVARGTLRSLIRSTGVTVADFAETWERT